MVANEGGQLVYREVCSPLVMEAHFHHAETAEEFAHFKSPERVLQLPLDEAACTVFGVNVPLDTEISGETVLEGGSDDVQDERIAFIPTAILLGQAEDSYGKAGSLEEIERSVRDMMCPS